MHSNNTRKKILLIETATSICSVALAEENHILDLAESDLPNSHSAKLHTLIDTMLRKNDTSYGDLSAVALSLGPGSYTGLRIGTSAAKGFAYALDVPVIGVETPCILANAALKRHKNSYVLTMIDARRMEVYANIFDSRMNEIKACSADILSEDIYDEYLADKAEVFLVGDGAEKTRSLFKNKPNYFYDADIRLSASHIAEPAWKKYLEKDFLDTAYFEPFYLKSYIAVHSQVKGLR